jgi:hypothetical protein
MTGSRPERLGTRTTLPGYFKELTFPGDRLSSPDFRGRPLPCWPGPRPIAQRALAARPSPAWPEAAGLAHSCDGRSADDHDRSESHNQSSPRTKGDCIGYAPGTNHHQAAPVKFFCSVERCSSVTAYAAARSGRQGWPLRPPRACPRQPTLGNLDQTGAVIGSYSNCNDIGVRSFILPGAPRFASASKSPGLGARRWTARAGARPRGGRDQ